jgi:hypothetical protein
VREIGLRFTVAVAGALALATCNPVPLTAPNESTMAVQANPRSIPAVGGESVITATVFKAADDGGGSVADGTQVFFTTDLGIIEERVGTKNGIARARLQSTGRAGQATVTASSGAIDAQTVTVEIGAGTEGELTITVVASPALLGPADFTSDIVATVTDNRGNLLADVPIIFSTDGGTLASEGAVLRTNGNGQAFDRLTLVDDNTTPITVTATSGSSTGSVTIARADFAAPIVDFVSPSSGNKGQTRTVTIGGQNFQPGATVSFGVGIGVDVVTFVNAETLEAVIRIDATASSGARDVRVTNPDGDSGTFTGGFTVN